MKYAMTPIGLVDALEDKIKEIIKNFDLKFKAEGTNDGGTKVPQVSTHYLPDKKRDQETTPEPDYPHVIIRFIEEKHNTALVHIIAGTYEPDSTKGWRDPLNILTRIKQELIKEGTLASFSLVESSYTTELFEDQVVPQWVALSTVKFEIPHPSIEGRELY